MNIEESTVVSHEVAGSDYRIVVLKAPDVARKAEPGQFVHLKVPGPGLFLLRRPFSIFKAGKDTIAILYKKVGRGTQAMLKLVKNDKVDIIGPLGNCFPRDIKGKIPLLVAGGYGVAPLYFLAGRLPAKGVVFIGAATSRDVLCVDEFKSLGWDVKVCTEDGSLGDKGYVTVALDAWLHGQQKNKIPEIFACGPDGMLKAISERAAGCEWKAWLSLDKHMGCGVGACLACVHKVRKPDGSSGWARVCREGPVFESRDVLWEEARKKN